MSQLTRPPDSYPEEVREAFEYCTECEKVVVSVDQHTCANGEGGNGRKSAAERDQLAGLDDRPLEDDVVIPKGGSENNAWAYHELVDGEPLHEVGFEAGHDIGTREDAIGKGCYPCGTCKLIESRRGGEDDG